MDTVHGGVTSIDEPTATTVVQKRKLTKFGDYSSKTAHEYHRNGVSESGRNEERESRKTGGKTCNRASPSSMLPVPLDFSTKKRKVMNGSSNDKNDNNPSPLSVSGHEKPSSIGGLPPFSSVPLDTVSVTCHLLQQLQRSIKDDHQRNYVDSTLNFLSENFNSSDFRESDDSSGATTEKSYQKSSKTNSYPLLDPVTLYNMSLLLQRERNIAASLPTSSFSTLSNPFLARHCLLNGQTFKGFDNRSSVSSPCLSRDSPRLDKIQTSPEQDTVPKLSSPSPRVSSTSHPHVDCGSPNERNGKDDTVVRGQKHQTSGEFYDSDSAAMSPFNQDDFAMVKQRRGHSLPEELKDNAYWERRRKNNEAAKKSRDARRAKEDEINAKASALEQENMRLRVEVAALKLEIDNLKKLLLTH